MCCNYQPKDQQALNLEKSKPKPVMQAALSPEEVKRLNSSFKGSTKLSKVIEIQARIRGFLVRRQIEKSIGRKWRADSLGNKMRQHSRKISASGKMNALPKINNGMRIVYAKMLNEIPNYSN